MTYRALISCPLIHDSIDEYHDRFAEHDIEYTIPNVEQQLTQEELLEIINGYDAVLAGDDEFTEEVLTKADNLKVISKWGIGTDNINKEAAQAEGVSVYNTPGMFNNEVADVVIGYAVMLTRHLHRIDKAVREGDWYCPRGVSLSGKAFGVVGVGNIGSAVARRASSLGMNVLGYDVQPIPEDIKAESGIEMVDLDELFTLSDVVSLNCPLTQNNKGMVDAEMLSKLGRSGYLINTARGELVNQAALVEALQKKTIAGAALDVFEDEPLPKNSPLVEMNNVILGSHNAQNTEEAVSRVNERAVENLINGLVDT